VAGRRLVRVGNGHGRQCRKRARLATSVAKHPQEIRRPLSTAAEATRLVGTPAPIAGSVSQPTAMKLHTILAFAFAACTASLAAQGPELPKPGAEHKALAARAGTWDAAIEMVGEDGKPQTSKGVSEMKVGCGGLWLIDDFTADMMGMKFEGHGTTGYDPVKAKYVGTWIDSWSTSVMAMEGTYDAAKKQLTMIGTGTGPDGKEMKHRMVTTEKDANTQVFEMYGAGPDGKEMKFMTITYTRRAKPAGCTK
jgi:hypothetical protein